MSISKKPARWQRIIRSVFNAFGHLLIEEEDRIRHREKYTYSPAVARQLLLIRDALAMSDLDEAYHQLYKIASPSFCDLDPWSEMEELAKTEPDE